jgi:hypothetical protein
MTGRLRAYVPLGVIAVLALAGCSGTNDEASPTLPSVTASHSSVPSTPDATTSPPQVVRAGPPPKTPFTKKGAELFVRDYYATTSDALRTADATDLRHYIRRGCECSYQVSLLDKLHKRHQHFVGRGYVLHRVRILDKVGNSAVVAVTFSLRRMPLVDRDGDRVDQLTDTRLQTDQLVLRYLAQRWFVERVFFGRAR